MSKYLIALSFMFWSTAYAHKEIQVIYHQVDAMYLEAVVNDSLRHLHKCHHKVKSVQYEEVNEYISSFMIVYENKK